MISTNRKFPSPSFLFILTIFIVISVMQITQLFLNEMKKVDTGVRL